MTDRTLKVISAVAIWATGAFLGWALIALLAYGLAP
jgi:hypothetical protein